MTRPVCHKCEQSSGVLLRRIFNSGGAIMIAWRCVECDCWTPSPVEWIKHETVKQIIKGHSIDEIPVIDDCRISCDICGKPGAQLHHFLPQMFARHEEIFPNWPQWCRFHANLCQYHHDLWHDLVTPWMPGRGNSRKLILDRMKEK